MVARLKMTLDKMFRRNILHTNFPTLDYSEVQVLLSRVAAVINKSEVPDSGTGGGADSKHYTTWKDSQPEPGRKLH
jgi:hypothetical protein